jgi:DNA-binding response OmpR family regulator
MADLLLVDNDPRIVELIAWFLTKRGHHVRTATSFAAARERIREQAPDLMLSDIDLGFEHGRDELPALAREKLLPPTLVVSGYLDRELARLFATMPGIVGVIAKPVGMAELESRIQSCLEVCGAPGVLKPGALQPDDPRAPLPARAQAPSKPSAQPGEERTE